MKADPRTFRRLADTLVELASELRKLDGSSETGLQLLPESSKGAVVDPTPELLTAAQVAKRLGCGSRTLRRWRAEGGFPTPLRLKGPPRWRRVDVDRWMERRARP